MTTKTIGVPNMKLRELLAKVPNISLTNNYQALETEIKGLATNSHACQTGDLFLGMPGTRVDGGDFWKSAIANGAVGAIVSVSAATKHPAKNECVIPVADMSQTCPEIAAAFYDYQ